MHGAKGTSYAFEYRMHDPRIGRFLSIDPLAFKYPWNSPYAFAENKVIQFIELEGLETAPSAAGSATTDAFNQPVQPANVIPRSDWGAKDPIIEPGRDYTPINTPLDQYYNTIVIHHSGNENNEMTVQELQEEHQGEDNKADIGYHFAIDPKGNIYEGRPIGIRGAHVERANTGKIGIVLLGDYDSSDAGLGWGSALLEVSDSELTCESVMALRNLVHQLVATYGIDYLGGHNDVNCERFCPGDMIQDAMTRLRSECIPLATPVGASGQ